MRFILHNRWLVFLAIVACVVAINWAITRSVLPSNDTEGLWFYAGLFLLAFSVFFVEPYFNSPQTTLANAVPTLLVLLTVRDSVIWEPIWWIATVLLGLLVVTAVAVMAIGVRNGGFEPMIAVAMRGLKIFGQARVVLSATFFLFLIAIPNQIRDAPLGFAALLGVWMVIVLINPAKLPRNLFLRRPLDRDLGLVGATESSHVWQSILHPGSPVPEVGAALALTDGTGASVLTVDRLHSAVKLRILRDSATLPTRAIGSQQTVRRSDSPGRTIPLGLITKGSTVESIYVEETAAIGQLFVGRVLAADVTAGLVTYQVVDVRVESDRLGPDDSAGRLVATASQLGIWHEGRGGFDVYPSVPPLHSRLDEVATESAPRLDLLKLGEVPGTALPGYLNIASCLGHHIAVIGTTGSGKSHLARRLVDALSETTKVVCVDFTGEWAKKYPGYTPVNTVPDLNAFLSSASKFAIVELPSASNTQATVKQLSDVMENLLVAAKAAFMAGQPFKVCLLLEEAHTIIPENSFLSVNDWDSKAAVNKIAQIALQGRKYGVGMIVLAQRTANVSKTVLTQCNTVIAFRVHDETSIGFLANYMGTSVSRALATLPDFHAVITGMGSPSTRPVIVKVDKLTASVTRPAASIGAP